MPRNLKSKIPVIYSQSYYVEIGDHIFPTSKYKLVKKRIETDNGLKDKIYFLEPSKATDKEILSVHSKEYISKLRSGRLTEDEIMRTELPYSKSIVEASIIASGGTLLAARESLKTKAAFHIGGGFHHAFSDHGEGFCLLNDIAVAAATLLDEKLIKKAMVIDCDLHQGNGTAYIFRNNKNVFTFSIHQENNYPFNKTNSTLDIGLLDYAGDREYIRELEKNIPAIMSTFHPDLLIYVAGADPYKDDQLGHLALTKDGLRKRDNFVLTQAFNFDVPCAVVLAGGYAYNRKDTVDIHYATLEECVKIFG